LTGKAKHKTTTDLNINPPLIESMAGEKASDTSEWIPRTALGKEVMEGKHETLEDILKRGLVILEPEIIGYLIPDMKSDIIYIGGSPGKGGGIRRTATKRTARMHKSGRRFKLTAMVVVGNENGIVGLGKASSKEHRIAIEKATTQAKLNAIRVKRACGSWECSCEENHSIPFKSEAKWGSVKVTLLPAPKGVGIVANESVKKMLKLAGIKDVWVKTLGQTSTRTNLLEAVFQALKNLNRTKGDL
jgi:small subunit ribosomal protein S5